METIGRNLDALSAFHAVASENSFSRAGEKLGLSKSMVSKLIKRLETHLSTQLLYRTTRKLALTEQGKALFEYSQKIFGLSDEAERRLRSLSEGDGGTIRISTPVGLGATFFSSFLSQISRELPNVTFHADISSEVRDLVGDRLDFAIRTTKDRHPEAIARYLGRIRDVVCASPEFLRVHTVGNDPRSLMTMNCVRYMQNPDWNLWVMSSASSEIKIEVSGRYFTNTYQAAHSMCLNGLGVARLPYYLAAEDLRGGRLIQVYPKHEITTHALFLVYLKTDYSSKKFSRVRKAILEWFKSRPEIFAQAVPENLGSKTGY